MTASAWFNQAELRVNLAAIPCATSLSFVK
jgi:hypothetical protein